MGKDPMVTKAQGAAYTGDSLFARQYQALMTNKEILKLQTQTLQSMPNFTLEKILAIQQQINDEIDALLMQENAKQLDLNQINHTELRNANHVYQKYRQSRSNAKGNNTSQPDTKEFYLKNQQFQKNGHYHKEEGLAQIGGAHLRYSLDPTSTPQKNIARATMDVLKTTNNRFSNEFFQLYDLLPAQDGVKYNRSTRSLSAHRIMSATPLASKSQAILGQPTTPNRVGAKSIYEQIFDKNYPNLGRVTYTNHWKSQERMPRHIKDP